MQTSLSLRLLPAAFVLSAFLLCCPAFAAHWVVTYLPSPKTVNTATNYGAAPVPWNNPPTTGDLNPDGSITEGRTPYMAVACSGTMNITLTWTPDNGVPLPPAPTQVSILVTVTCDAMGLSGTITDSFGDNYPGNGTAHASGSFSHVVQVANASQATILTVPVAVDVSSTGHYPTDAWANWNVKLVSPVLQGYSTHIAPALTQVEQIPLTTWDPANPRYFSGTGCEARGTAVPLTGCVSHAQLLVNDTVVEEYWDSAAAGKPNPLPTDGSVVTGTSQTSATVKALFDSTHFADASSITIKMKVTDSNGGNYQATVVGPAYNKAYIMQNDTPTVASGDPGILVYSVLERVVHDLGGVNYDTSMNSDSDRGSDMLAKFPIATVYYADTHTSDTGIGDCFNLGVIAQSGIPGTVGGVQYSDVSVAIAKKNVQNATYSSPSMPPYNLVFVDGCHSAGEFKSGGDNSLSGGAASFGVVKPATDRAFLGWTNFVSLWPEDDGTGFTEILFDNLSKNYDLYTACTMSVADSPRIGWLGEDIYGKDKFNTGPLSPYLIGDPHLKLHGVYGDVILGYLLDSKGTETVVLDRNAWFKPL